MLDSIKAELETNELLLEDFPEVCFPIHCLEGIANRCSGQLQAGNRTQISWTASEIVLPTVESSPASGAIIRVAGITGRIRGMKFKRSDGQTVRPSLVILDDPQTDESARSLSQCANRERILAGAVLGLAGPGQKISGIMPCTVIRPGDMADNILDSEKHPEWNGERTQMVYSFPTNQKLWAKYEQLRGESFRAYGDIRLATEFYKQHRKAMDAGAKVAWAERFNHDELSAIQHAMNLKMQNETAFFAEYQNQPLAENDVDDDTLSVDEICQKLNGYRQFEIPIACNHLTMFIDVQGKLLYYVVAAWESDFTGYVVDYGAYPKQHMRYFSLREAQPSLADKAGDIGLEAAIYSGLEKLTSELLHREFRRDDGAMMKISRCIIDANWGQSTDVVYQFCRQSSHSAILLPGHGRYVGASSKPFSEYRKKPGDQLGHNWRIPGVRGRRPVRHVLYDTNYWKTFLQRRFSVAMGGRGCVSIYGRKPAEHQLFAEHLTPEFKVRTSGRGREVDEWKLRPSACDNHWLDCLVGCAVAASIQDATLPGTQTTTPKPRKKIKLSELQNKKCEREIAGGIVWAISLIFVNGFQDSATFVGDKEYKIDSGDNLEIGDGFIGQIDEGIVAGKTTEYAFAGNQVIAEYEKIGGENSLKRKFVFASYVDSPKMMVTVTGTNEAKHYYHQNSNFNVIALTDAAGNVVEKYAYTAYGKADIFTPGADNTWNTADDVTVAPLTNGVKTGLANASAASTVDNPYLFTGRRLDAESGLYYFRARYHDANLGRFISRDPLEYIDGLSLYAAYFAQNFAMDPEGMKRRRKWKRKTPGYRDKVKCMAECADYYYYHRGFDSDCISFIEGDGDDPYHGRIAAQKALKTCLKSCAKIGFISHSGLSLIPDGGKNCKPERKPSKREDEAIKALKLKGASELQIQEITAVTISQTVALEMYGLLLEGSVSSNIASIGSSVLGGMEIALKGLVIRKRKSLKYYFAKKGFNNTRFDDPMFTYNAILSLEAFGKFENNNGDDEFFFKYFGDMLRNKKSRNKLHDFLIKNSG